MFKNTLMFIKQLVLKKKIISRFFVNISTTKDYGRSDTNGSK